MSDRTALFESLIFFQMYDGYLMIFHYWQVNSAWRMMEKILLLHNLDWRENSDSYQNFPLSVQFRNKILYRYTSFCASSSSDETKMMKQNILIWNNHFRSFLKHFLHAICWSFSRKRAQYAPADEISHLYEKCSYSKKRNNLNTYRIMTATK